MGEFPARRVWPGIAAALAVATAFGGCSESSIGPALGPPPPSVVSTIAPLQTSNVRVSARDNDFIDKEITVAVGTEVVWKNEGRNDHNITPVDGGDFQVDTAKFGPKAEYRHTFTKPGTYRYFCSIHGTADKGMPGTVQVIASDKAGEKS